MKVQIGGNTVSIRVQSSGIGAALEINRTAAADALSAASSAAAAGTSADDAAASAAAAASTLAGAALKASNGSDFTDPSAVRANIGADLSENINSPVADVTVADALNALPADYLLAAAAPTTFTADGDSFFLQPNVHTAGDSLAYKYAINRGYAPGDIDIQAVSGQTSADGQALLFARSIASTNEALIGFGQNDAQFIGTSPDLSKYTDIAKQMLASQLWLGIADGTNSKVRANGLGVTESGVWGDDPDIAGARRSTAGGAVISKTFANARWIIVWKKVENGSGGYGHVDTNQTSNPIIRFAPAYTSVLTNGSTDYAVQAEYYDLGRVVESVVVQVIVDSATDAGNAVSVVGFGALSGEPMTAPLLGVCDVSDRGPAGYATAGGGGAEQSVAVISRINLLMAGVCALMGVRVVDFPLSKYLPVSTALAADEFHPSEAGATSAAALMAARVINGRTVLGARPDLIEQARMLGVNADGLAQGAPVVLSGGGQMVSRRIGANGLFFQTGDNLIPNKSGVRFCAVDSTDTTLPDASIVVIHDGTVGYIQSVTGALTLGSSGANQLLLSTSALTPTTNDTISLGNVSGLAYNYVSLTLGVWVQNLQVLGGRKTGWALDTGTARRAANASYAAGATLTFGATYVQAELTALATRLASVESALQNATETIKALKDDLHADGGGTHKLLAG